MFKEKIELWLSREYYYYLKAACLAGADAVYLAGKRLERELCS